MICQKCKDPCFVVDIEKLERASYMIIAEKPTNAETISGNKLTSYKYARIKALVKEVGFNEPIYATYMQKMPYEYTIVRSRKCFNHLLCEINQVRPRVILCVGSNVSKFISGKTFDIAHFQNRPYYDAKFNAWIICCYDPGICIRLPNIVKDIENTIINFRRLKFTAHNFEKNVPIIISNSVTRNLKILRAMAKWNYSKIFFDIETESVDYYKSQVLAIGFTWKTQYSEKIVAYILGRKMGENLEIQEAINELFANPTIEFAAQNAKFDTSFLRFKRPGKVVVIPNARFDDDTMLMHYCIDESTGTHGLKTWARDYFDAPDWEAGIKKYLPNDETLYSAIPTDILHRYLSWDVYWLQKGFFLFEKLLAEMGTERVYSEIYLPVAQAFTEIEMEGVKLDVEALKQKMKEAEPEMERIAKELLEEAKKVGWSPEAYVEATEAKSTPTFFNVKSHKQLSWVAYDLCKMPLWYMGKDGMKKSCCKDAVEVYRHKHPFWKKLAEFKEVNDLFGIYVKGMLEAVDDDGFIRPDFFLIGTVTGRISCRSPNLQNLPRNSFVKRMFIPKDDDHIICNVDYKTLEVIVAALLSGDENMLKPFKEGKDFHTQVTWTCYGDDLRMLQQYVKANQGKLIADYLERAQMQEIRKVGQQAILDGNLEKAYDIIFDYLRFLTKFVTFGILYKRGPRSLAEGELNCSIADAQVYIEKFEADYPQLIEWQKQNLQKALTKGYVENFFGFKRRWINVTSDDYKVQPQSANTPIQSTAAHITLRALHILHKKLKETKLGRILFTVHDSIVFELPKKCLDRSLSLIHKEMTFNPLSNIMPLAVEIEIGPNYKDLIEVRPNENGVWTYVKEKHKEAFQHLLNP